jgi:hypothetical protein
VADPAKQKWLSLSQIALLLGISESHAVWLARQGFLHLIWGNKKKDYQAARYLDPTPEYAEQLKRSEMLYGRMYPTTKDLEDVPLLSSSEVAAILGITEKAAALLLWRWRVPHYISPHAGHTNLYSVEAIRKLLWKKSSRSTSYRRSPFLLLDLVEFFRQKNARAEAEVPTDQQYEEDEMIQRKLARMLRMPYEYRLKAIQEFFAMMETAKRVAKCLPPAS